MHTVKENVETSVEEVAVPEVTAKAEKKEAVLLLENFMSETIQSLNTYRVKRETTYNNFKAALLVYLNEQVSNTNISSYALNIKQSGAKKMGIYIVGFITLTLNGEETEVALKLHMNGWIASKAEIDAKKSAAKVKATATDEAAA